MEGLRLNLGCARQTPNGWVNVDYALGARVAKLPLFRMINKKLRLFNVEWNDEIFLHNLTKPFPWADNAASVIYSSHTLEHFSRNDGVAFLKECFRVLMPGGIARIIVPDLAVIVDRYKSGDMQADAFLDALHVTYEQKGDGNFKRILAPLIRYPHKCMYDTKTLLRVMSDIGFTVKSCNSYESEINNISVIELESRATDAVIVEGIKQ